jgi:preprotein translocase subunit YajC
MRGPCEVTTDKIITLEIAENVRIRVLRSQVAGLAKEGNQQ